MNNRIIARLALALGSFGLGISLGMLGMSTLASTSPATVTPSGLCAIPAVPGHQDASVLVSGDAGILWTPGAAAPREYVCTDSTLVPVEGYGVRPAPVNPAAYTRPVSMTVVVSPAVQGYGLAGS